MSVDYENYRTQQMSDHDAFCEWLWENQYSRGENRLGIEFKMDKRYPDTGNLCIEQAEKARPRRGAYFPSGICRSDNTWLYVMGNYSRAWVFLKQTLVDVSADGFRPYQTGTSEGYLLPVEDANKLALRVIEF